MLRARNPLLPVLLLVLIPAGAQASIPPAQNATVPPCFSLVGTSAAGAPADAAGRFTVVIRDLANFPLSGVSVVIDLSICSDLQICADQRDPAATVNCLAKTVRKFTAADGSASFTILGGSNGGSAIEEQGGGRVYANGALMRAPTVSAFDLDGANGVGVNDLSVWLGDFGTVGNPAFGRSDFDCNGSVGVNDLSVWLGGFASGAQVRSCAASCP